MDLKYDFIPDLDADNSHARQLRAVPPGSRVLELGCATGYLSRIMAEQLGCRVTGVEIDPDAAERARAFCEAVHVLDLDAADLGAVFPAQAFDVVLAGDVLEHLKRPDRVLRALVPLMAPGGRMVATIPNVAHGDLRLALLAGRFDYRRLGLLDDTHLRFFTRAGIHRVFEGAGWAVHRVLRIEAPLFTTELEVKPGDVPAEAVAFVSADPDALAYQYLVVASPEADHPALVEARLRREAAEADAGRLAHQLEDARGRVAALEAEVRAAREAGEAARAAAEAEGRARLAAAEAGAEAAARDAEARRRAEVEAARAEALAAGDARAAEILGHHAALEARFFRLRRLSWFNPVVLADAAWRRVFQDPKEK